MEKIILTTVILLLCISCAVTKQEKLGYSADKENYNQTVQTTQAGTHKESGENKNTASASASVQGTTDSDYNPYRHAREEYIKTGEEFFEEFQNVNCEENKELIQSYINVYYNEKSSNQEIEMAFSIIGQAYCPEIIDFFIEVVAIDSSEKVRCDAIQKLGWLRAKSAVPILRDHLSKDISDYEKACIGSCLTGIGEWDLAQQALNSVCFCKDNDFIDKCLWSYYIIGNESAIRYFNYFLEFPESRVWAANYLAELGEYEKTFPIFVESIDSGKNIILSILGLAIIGTEDALRLIEEQTQNKNEIIAKKAQEILRNFDMGRRKK